MWSLFHDLQPLVQRYMPTSAEVASARLAAAQAAAQAGQGVFSLVDEGGWDGGGGDEEGNSQVGEGGGGEGGEAGPSQGDEVDRLVEALAAAARAPPAEEGPGTEGAAEDHGDQHGSVDAAAGRLVSGAASAPPHPSPLWRMRARTHSRTHARSTHPCMHAPPANPETQIGWAMHILTFVCASFVGRNVKSLIS